MLDDHLRNAIVLGLKSEEVKMSFFKEGNNLIFAEALEIASKSTEQKKSKCECY